MKKYLVALDQGTTSSRAIVFDRSQQIVASAQKEFPQLYPQAGWVEHDPLELYSSQYGVMMEAITRGGIDPAEIAAIGITNQRETTIVWEKATGRPIYPAIVWQCRRTAALCDRLRADGLTEHIRAVRLFLGYKNSVDPRPCARCAGARRARRAAVRHGGFVAHLEADARPRSRNGRDERLTHHAL